MEKKLKNTLKTQHNNPMKPLSQIVQESVESAKVTIPQEILGAMEHRGFYDAGKYLDDDVIEPVIKHFISSQISLLEAELLRKKGMMKGMPIRSMEDLALGLAKYDELSERDKSKIKNRDNGYYVEVMEFSIHNKAIQEDITYLQEQISEIKKLNN